MKGGSMPSDSDWKCGFLDYNYGSPQWTNRRNSEMGEQAKVTNAVDEICQQRRKKKRYSQRMGCNCLPPS
jgi:hypothetical protein